MGSGLVGLQVKGSLTDKSFAVWELASPGREGPSRVNKTRG